jgi:hypothetical protein
MKDEVRIQESIIFPFERLEKFKYLGTTLTKQNSTHEEVKSRLNKEIACYRSVQNVLSYIMYLATQKY